MDVLRAAEVREVVVLLNEDQFAHLLFHGFDERANHIIGEQFDRSFLRALFPEQDFVIWAADAQAATGALCELGFEQRHTSAPEG